MDTCLPPASRQHRQTAEANASVCVDATVPPRRANSKIERTLVPRRRPRRPHGQCLDPKVARLLIRLVAAIVVVVVLVVVL